MPLQNRVTPFGAIVRNGARGMMMGNRGGRLHDAASRTLTGRRWASKRWIICVTAFRGRHRQVMAPGTYTELFFLDEVTALAAGHRPCFECRNADAKAYAAAFPGGKLPADDMDAVLHQERCVSGKPQPRIGRKEAQALPVGAMFADGNMCFAIGPKGLLRWSFEGYVPLDEDESDVLSAQNGLILLTPQASVAALKNGYRPAFHPTAPA